jgi:hypothetical protein
MGGIEQYEDEIWKMIAFASRYGHQPLVAMTGDVSVERVQRFCKWVAFWIANEQKNGSAHANHMAEGGG